MFDQINLWVTEQLASSAGPRALLLLFVGGVLASLLPCVYPLYPITAAILRGRSSRLGRAAHPLAYYGGLAGVYMAFGVVAAFTGGAFNEIMRTAGFNLVIGGVLLALAGAVVGLLEFPVLAQPTAGAPSEEQVHRLSGTAAMGAGAGLLSSACVGPVVVSVLVGLVVTAEAITPSLVAASATKMAVFGMGVGLPVVLIGVFGLSLPRAGRWMVWVQRAFGVLIAYFALGYAAKGLVGLGMDTGVATSVELGAMLVLGAAFFLQDEDKAVHERGRHAFLVLAAVAGFFVMARGLIPVGPAMRTAEESSRSTSETEHGLTWYLDRELAYDEAAKTGKMVFIDFYGSWCTNCKNFQANVGKDESLRAALGNAVLLKVYDTSPLFKEYRADERFPELSVGLPFFLITDAEGNVVYKTNDFAKTDEMKLFLEG